MSCTNQVKTVALYSGKEWDLNSPGKRGLLIGWLRRSWHDCLEVFLLAWDWPMSSKHCRRCEHGCIRQQISFASGSCNPSRCFLLSLNRGLYWCILWRAWLRACCLASNLTEVTNLRIHLAKREPLWFLKGFVAALVLNTLLWEPSLSRRCLTALCLPCLSGWVSSRLFVRNSKITVKEHPGTLKVFISRKSKQIQQKMSRERHLNILYIFFLLKGDSSHVPGLLYRNWPLGILVESLRYSDWTAWQSCSISCGEGLLGNGSTRKQHSTPCLPNLSPFIPLTGFQNFRLLPTAPYLYVYYLLVVWTLPGSQKRDRVVRIEPSHGGAPCAGTLT